MSRAKIIVKKKGYMNSGMFFMRKDSIIKNFKKYQYSMFKNCFNSVINSRKYKNIYYLNKSSFKKAKEISFDYAILEKSKDINGINLNIPMTDLGNWKEIWKYFKKNKSRKSIKKHTFYRPWGKYINLFRGKDFLLKELVINAKSSISLQRHYFRSERWTLVSGKPKVTINKSKFFLHPGQTAFIPRGAVHRIENNFSEPVQIVEVQMGQILKETDITRYHDIYGRVK